jgi:hypothetical protein
MVDEIQRRREAFIRWQQASGLTVAAIYRASGVPESTIRSYINGKADSLKGTTQALIAAAYGVSTADLFGDNQSVNRLGVFGRIGAKGDVFSVDRDSDAPMYDLDLSPAPGASEDFVGFEIDGFSMPPAGPGWIIMFRRKALPPQDLVGTPCMVRLTDGRRYFKRLRRGYAAGKWNLESWDGSPLIEDVEISEALAFAALVPGRLGSR